MPAAIAHRRIVAGLALACYGGVFIAMVVFETPGLGIGHFFYLPIALVALATGRRGGALAGLAATGIYAAATALDPHVPSSEAVTISSAIRLVTFTSSGMLIGAFVSRNRALVERLQVLAERDFLTGLLNARAFEEALLARCEAEKPFALLLGDMDGLKQINDRFGHVEGNAALRRLATGLAAELRSDDVLARVGGDEFGLITAASSPEEARRLCDRLEKALAGAGLRISFGWAIHGPDARGALALFRRADERLYERKQQTRSSRLVAVADG